MKMTSLIKKASAAFAAFALAGAFVLAPKVAAAVPYDPSHQGATTPTFNMYSGTPSVGDEADFLRGKEAGATGYVNNVTSACGNGQKFALRVYVHNGANQTLNNGGTGVGVAHDTKVKVALPGSASANFSLNSTISASNASSVSDGMTINCNGKVRKLSYVAGSAQQYTVPGGTKSLSDSIVTTGALIGTNEPNGDVWGCWDQRVWVTLEVKVEEVPEEPKPQLLTCDFLTYSLLGDRRVRLDQAKYTATNGATFSGLNIDWGDGNKSNGVLAPQTHQYSKDGVFKLIVSINGTVDGKNVSVSSANCAANVETKKVSVCDPATGNIITVDEQDADKYKSANDAACKKQPVTPTVLPDTGVGSMLGLFAVVTMAGAIAHRIVLARR